MTKLIEGIAGMLRHLGARQQVIATNLANADTPRFKARTLEAPDFSALVGGGGGVARPTVAPTAGMQALGGGRQRSDGSILDREAREVKPDGNNVSLEQQMMQLGEIQADYATLTALYRKQMSLLRSAIGGRGA